MTYFENFKKYILDRSIEKEDLRLALTSEWKIETTWEETDYGDEQCCCTHNIKYVSKIINELHKIIDPLTGDFGHPTALVGSSCILMVSKPIDFEEYSTNIFKDIKSIESVRKREYTLKLKFGKYKDELFRRIPFSYINWFKDNYVKSRGFQKPAIKKNMHDLYIFATYIKRED